MRSARMRRSRSSRSRAWATRPRASSVSEAICACSSAATGRVSPREARSAASRCRRSASWRRTPASSGVSITSPAAVTSLAASAARSWLSREPASACSVRATASALPTSRSWFAVVAGSPTAAASISRRRAWMPRFCSAMRARRSPISPRIQASARSAASRLVRSCATRYSSTTALANDRRRHRVRGGGDHVDDDGVEVAGDGEAGPQRVDDPGGGRRRLGRERRRRDAGEPAAEPAEGPGDGVGLGRRAVRRDRPAARVDQPEPAGGALEHRGREQDGDLVRDRRRVGDDRCGQHVGDLAELDPVALEQHLRRRLVGRRQHPRGRPGGDGRQQDRGGEQRPAAGERPEQPAQADRAELGLGHRTSAGAPTGSRPLARSLEAAA